MFDITRAGQRRVLLRCLSFMLLLSALLPGCAALGSYPVRLEVYNDSGDGREACADGLQARVLRGSEVVVESPRVEAGEIWRSTTAETFSPGEASVEALCYQETQTGVFEGTAYLGYNKSSVGMFVGVAPNQSDSQCLYDDPAHTSEIVKPAPCVF